MSETPPAALDCLVIGAGPGGLTAAVYLARFRRRFAVVESGESRADWDYVSHNLPGYPDGIASREFLARLRRQAERYGADIKRGRVEALTTHPRGGFTARLADGAVIEARTIILATGAEDVEPELPGIESAVRRGLIRHCPICDAYEVIDKRVALIGYGKCRIREAFLLRAYTSDLTVLTLGRELTMSDEEREALRDRGIAVIAEPIKTITLNDDQIEAWQTGSGAELRFDRLYTALGFKVRSDLARGLGARLDEDGAVLTDDHQRTSVPGLYAAGDVVRGLAQISVALGQAAIAATDINNTLAQRYTH